MINLLTGLAAQHIFKPHKDIAAKKEEMEIKRRYAELTPVRVESLEARLTFNPIYEQLEAFIKAISDKSFEVADFDKNKIKVSNVDFFDDAQARNFMCCQLMDIVDGLFKPNTKSFLYIETEDGSGLFTYSFNKKGFEEGTFTFYKAVGQSGFPKFRTHTYSIKRK